MLTLIKKLNDILSRRDKWKLAVLFVMMLIAGLAEALSIGILAGFVAVVADPQLLFGNERLAGLLDFFGITTQQDILVYGAIFLIVAFFLKNAYLIFFRYVKLRFIFTNQYLLVSTRLFNIYMNAPYSFHLKRNSANLIRNVVNETQYLAGDVIFPFLEIVTETVMAFTILLLLFIAEPIITLVALVVLGGSGLLFLRSTRNRIRKHGKNALKKRAKVIKAVNEGIGGFVDATIMGRQGWFVDKFKQSMITLSKAKVFSQVTKKSAQPITETIAVIAMFLIAFLFLRQGRSIASLASMLALFVLALRRLLPAINSIINQYTSIRYYAYSLDPIHKDLTTLQSHLRPGQKCEIKRLNLKEEIELKNLSYIYPKSKEEVLSNISITIPNGSAVGFVGATGSGKTTLVNLILGLIEPAKGNIYLDGKNFKENLFAWQKNIGYIPQFIYLSDDTIKNNIVFGLNPDQIDLDRLKQAIRVAQLESFIQSLPQKEDTFIGERGIRLSGGQRQRIGIARALYNNPQVLIMDEATSSLDNITEKFLVQAIERLRKNHTMIIVAHRLTTVKNCDMIYFFDKGKVIAQGRYEELLKKSVRFKEMARES